MAAKSSRDGWAAAVAAAVAIESPGSKGVRVLTHGRAVLRTGDGHANETIERSETLNGRRGGLASNSLRVRLAAPSARPGCLHDGKCGPDRRFYIQLGGIEQDRVRRGFQGRNRPPGITGVAPLEVGEYLVEGDGLALRHELPMAAFRAPLHRGGDEDLGLGRGRDHRTGVAAVEDRAPGSAREGLLKIEERRAHLGNGGDHRGRLAEVLAGQPAGIEMGKIDRLGRSHRGRAIVRALARGDDGGADSAIEEPGVEMRKLEVPRQRAGECAFARSGGPVDGDDHRPRSAPSLPMSSTKPGKLVATNEASSTATGLSLASPMTRKAMAMRG